mgnify:FL=1
MKNRREKKYIFQLMLRYKKELILNTVLSFFLLAIYMVTPILEQKIIDEGILSKDYVILLKLVFIAAFIGIVGYFIQYIQMHIQSGVAAAFRSSLKVEALSHALRLKMCYLKKYSMLALMSDANNDVNNMSRVCSSDVIGIFIEFINVIGYFIGLLFLSWKLSLLVLCIVPLKIFISSFCERLSKTWIEKLLQIQKDISRWQSDNYSGVEEIKNWDMYEHIEAQFQVLSKKREQYDKRVAMLTSLDSCLKQGSEKILFTVIYMVAASQIWNDQLTIGTLMAFIQYAGCILTPIDVITALKMVIANIIPSTRDYIEFMNMEEENLHSGNIVAQVPQKIIFNKIHFSYDRQEVLRDFNLVLNRGEKVALVGLNGSGKSTLVNLLLRYYSPQKGNILFDTKDVKEFSLDDYRKKFSIMRQKVFLFNATIQDNIYMFKNEYEKERFSFPEILGFVDDLPQGGQTSVGFDGTQLSGGEKQRVALARCLKKDANILILDEATSNCDVAMENVFIKSIKEDKHDFLICITHNFRILEEFDRIILLKDGKIFADGTFHEINSQIQGMESQVPAEHKKKLRKRIENERENLLQNI